MSQVAPPHSRALAIFLGVSLPFVWIVLVFVLPLFFHPFDCPAETLVSGHLNIGNGLLAIGGGLSGIALFLAMFRYGARRSARLSPVKRRTYRRVGAVGFGLTAVSLLMWLDGLFTYYCATSKEIVVHPAPLAETVAYIWARLAPGS